MLQQAVVSTFALIFVDYPQRQYGTGKPKKSYSLFSPRSCSFLFSSLSRAQTSPTLSSLDTLSTRHSRYPDLPRPGGSPQGQGPETTQKVELPTTLVLQEKCSIRSSSSSSSASTKVLFPSTRRAPLPTCSALIYTGSTLGTVLRERELHDLLDRAPLRTCHGAGESRLRPAAGDCSTSQAAPSASSLTTATSSSSSSSINTFCTSRRNCATGPGGASAINASTVITAPTTTPSETTGWATRVARFLCENGHATPDAPTSVLTRRSKREANPSEIGWLLRWLTLGNRRIRASSCCTTSRGRSPEVGLSASPRSS